MYQVFKKVDSKGMLQYVTEYPNLVSAQAHAKKLKGVVKINGHICYDLTGYTRIK
jgi:hypothetical protein